MPRSWPAYDSAHYRSLDAVIDDLLARGRSGDVAGTWGEDYAIWRAGRQVGRIRTGGVARARGPHAEPGAGGESGPIRISESIRDDYRAA